MKSGAPRGTLEDLLRKQISKQDAVITHGVVDVVSACTEEFVRTLLSESDTIAKKRSKSEMYRITPDHVLKALSSFPGIQQRISKLDDNMLHKKEPRSKRKLKGKSQSEQESEEQLKEEQAALFERAAKAQYGRIPRIQSIE
ncbi:unnamed protein product [Aphanomyces euteiches]|uniref:Transcription factor CBF/NF-Y/archaeal histone domain-containing protein n=1 Tax=Aphanomyces euteiches TaxID=100861 RepID=A0A6G0X0W3_9STRA|nr:hypothetical protein Ae201684_009673 [Aphanomyces euteiches]KAH9154908.1 hypothetical protein AeRB84_003074 [Aphanomyces euteiches]